MATTTFVTVEEYLRSSYDPDAEYIDGFIEERIMGERDHSMWQKALILWFGPQEKQSQILVYPELCVQVSQNNFHVPDVTILDRNRPIEQIVTHPPIAVFEILSPEDSFQRVMIKCGKYAEMGIQNILVLDPAGPNYRFVSGRLEPLTERSFILAGSQARFDLDEIEKLLD